MTRYIDPGELMKGMENPTLCIDRKGNGEYEPIVQLKDNPMTPKGTHIQHPEASTTETVSTKHVTTTRQIIKSTTPLLKRMQVATILGITPIQVDRRAKAGMLTRADMKGIARFDMFDNGLDPYVQLVDDLGEPLEG